MAMTLNEYPHICTMAACKLCRLARLVQAMKDNRGRLPLSVYFRAFGVTE